MADQALNEEEKEAEEQLEKWIDDWLSGKLDDFSFGTLTVLNWLEKKLWGYQKYAELKPHIRLLMGCVSDRHEAPKEKQQVKEKLQKIKRIWSDYESSKAEKEQDADAVFDEIVDLLLEITGLVTVGEK
jgi:hypothetical protein